MTVNDIRRMDADFLTAQQTAEVMHMSVDKLRWYARNGQLPFPVQLSGNTMKISRVGFLNWVAGKKDPEHYDIATELHVMNIWLEAIVRNMAPVSYSRYMEKVREIYGVQDDQNVRGAQVPGEAVG